MTETQLKSLAKSSLYTSLEQHALSEVIYYSGTIRNLCNNCRSIDFRPTDSITRLFNAAAAAKCLINTSCGDARALLTLIEQFYGVSVMPHGIYGTMVNTSTFMVAYAEHGDVNWLYWQGERLNIADEQKINWLDADNMTSWDRATLERSIAAGSVPAWLYSRMTAELERRGEHKEPEAKAPANATEPEAKRCYCCGTKPIKTFGLKADAYLLAYYVKRGAYTLPQKLQALIHDLGDCEIRAIGGDVTEELKLSCLEYELLEKARMRETNPV